MAAKRIKTDCSGFLLMSEIKIQNQNPPDLPPVVTSRPVAPLKLLVPLAHLRRWPAGLVCAFPLPLCLILPWSSFCVSSVYCLNKALGRYLVFTGAQRRPRQDRSSGEGGQRGLLWGSPVSVPARSPQRCP